MWGGVMIVPFFLSLKIEVCRRYVTEQKTIQVILLTLRKQSLPTCTMATSSWNCRSFCCAVC